jgi:hypothetical protein
MALITLVRGNTNGALDLINAASSAMDERTTLLEPNATSLFKAVSSTVKAFADSEGERNEAMQWPDKALDGLEGCR